MTTIEINCPACHSRCQLRNSAGKSLASRGKCPECGHIFPLPPGLKNSRASLHDEVSAGGDPPRRRKFLSAGLALLLLLAGGGLFLARPPRPAPKAPASVSVPPPALPALTPAAREEIIAHIKQHALVGDAGIHREPDRYRLFLLVGRNTPPAYAEELGRRFAFYLQKRLPRETGDSGLPLEVSVYYPGGTRLEVAWAGHDYEEEILHQKEGQTASKIYEESKAGGKSAPPTGTGETNGNSEEKPGPVTTGTIPAATPEDGGMGQ